MPDLWYLLPFIAAAIGWFTNYLAVKMIFRPYRPISILGVKVQGLLPKRQREFAESIGSTIEDHLITAEDIRRTVEAPEVRERLDRMLSSGIDEFLTQKLAALNPMIAGFLGGGLAEKIKGALTEQLRGMLARGVEEIGEHLDENLDVGGMVARKVEGFDMHRLEAIVLRVARSELRGIEILGAVLGFIIGLVQVALLAIGG